MADHLDFEALGPNARERLFHTKLSDTFDKMRNTHTPVANRLVDFLTFLLVHLSGFQGIDWPEQRHEHTTRFALTRFNARLNAMNLAARHILIDTAAIVALLDEEYYFVVAGTMFVTEAGIRYLAEENVFENTLGAAGSERLRAIVAVIPEEQEE